MVRLKTNKIFIKKVKKKIRNSNTKNQIKKEYIKN